MSSGAGSFLCRRARVRNQERHSLVLDRDKRDRIINGEDRVCVWLLESLFKTLSKKNRRARGGA